MKWKEALKKKSAESMHKVFCSCNVNQLIEFKKYIESLIIIKQNDIRSKSKTDKKP